MSWRCLPFMSVWVMHKSRSITIWSSHFTRKNIHVEYSRTILFWNSASNKCIQFFSFHPQSYIVSFPLQLQRWRTYFFVIWWAFQQVSLKWISVVLDHGYSFFEKLSLKMWTFFSIILDLTAFWFYFRMKGKKNMRMILIY